MKTEYIYSRKYIFKIIWDEEVNYKELERDSFRMNIFYSKSEVYISKKNEAHDETKFKIYKTDLNFWDEVYRRPKFSSVEEIREEQRKNQQFRKEWEEGREEREKKERERLLEKIKKSEERKLVREQNALKKYDKIKNVGTPVNVNYKVWGGSRKHRKIVDEIEDRGILYGNWIYFDDGTKKKANGNWLEYSHLTTQQMRKYKLEMIR